MKSSKIICGLAFACSVACLFFAYRHFQDGNNSRALIYSVVGVVSGIINFNGFMED